MKKAKESCIVCVLSTEVQTPNIEHDTSPLVWLQNKYGNSLTSTVRVHSSNAVHIHQINDPSTNIYDWLSAYGGPPQKQLFILFHYICMHALTSQCIHILPQFSTFSHLLQILTWALECQQSCRYFFPIDTRRFNTIRKVRRWSPFTS
jgi:hypothetical protein